MMRGESYHWGQLCPLIRLERYPSLTVYCYGPETVRRGMCIGACHTTGQPIRGREGREGLQMCVYDCCVVRLIPAIIFWSQSLQGLEKLNFREENIGLSCVFFWLPRWATRNKMAGHNGGTDADVWTTIWLATTIFQKMRKIWATKSVNLTTKIRLYRSCVVPIATYASETWRATKMITHRLNVFNQKCLRKILGISFSDHIRNEEVLKRSEVQTIAGLIKQKRVRWAGHVLRMPECRHPKTAFSWKPRSGKRSPIDHLEGNLQEWSSDYRSGLGWRYQGCIRQGTLENVSRPMLRSARYGQTN